MTEYIEHHGYRYEIVDYVPSEYSIWNIGKNAPDGYIPLCQLSEKQPFEGARAINPNSLKAIKIASADKVMIAIGGGNDTVEKMEYFLQKNKYAKPESWQSVQCKRIEEALPIMRKIFR